VVWLLLEEYDHSNGYSQILFQFRGLTAISVTGERWDSNHESIESESGHLTDMLTGYYLTTVELHTAKVYNVPTEYTILYRLLNKSYNHYIKSFIIFR